MNNFELEYTRYLEIFNSYLEEKFNEMDKKSPHLLREAMQYAVLDGGKRIRPILCLAFADVFNVPYEKVLDYALAIECLHSYSLVHDDLPCMDNDDYRRGKLSTHKKFGQAMGVLVGDALLNLAIEICLEKEKLTVRDINAIRTIFNNSGYKGMIAGQVLDLQNERVNSVDENLLYDIYYNKTSKLILAPILAVACFTNKKYYKTLEEYGYNLGILFQITDDLLDVIGDATVIGKTPNKDSKCDKLTAIKVFGIEGAKERAKYHYKNCIKCLKKLNKNKFVLSITDNIYNRNK